MCGCSEAQTVIDVRQLAPKMRHPLIFGAFDMLEPGESFLLVNDHDPVPLQYQFSAYHPGAFSWDYEERGPTLWRVRITRPAG